MSQIIRFTIDESGNSVIVNRWPGRLGCNLHIGQIVSIRTDSARVKRVRILEHTKEVETDAATGTKYVWLAGEVVEPLSAEQDHRKHKGKIQHMAMSSL